MKKLNLFGIAAAALIGSIGLVLAVDAVEPATLAVTNKRAEAVTAPSQETFFRGSTLRLTNCTVYADSTTNTVQGLDGVTVQVRISNGTTLTNSTAYTGTVVSAASGTWWKDVTVPDYPDCYLQVKLTDASTNVYIYPWKILRTKDVLQ
jgi:hypothetical protein